MYNRDKVFVIAEAGVNHNGDIRKAYQLIDVAIDAKADAVKFQTFVAEEVVSSSATKATYQKETTGSNESQLDMIKKLELSFDDFIELKEYCDKKGIIFLSTAFDMKSIDFLSSLNMAVWKIPSGEITNMPYLERIGASGKDIILSTGMSTLGDIENAIDILTRAGTALEAITLLHCNTQYPTPAKDVNLRAMNTIGAAFGTEIGYSDHTLGIEVSLAAVAMGGKVIEKHFTLDCTLEGPDHRASLDPKELRDLVHGIRVVEMALGIGIKTPSPSEKENLNIARKSLHLSRDLKKGDSLRAVDISIKRPGGGISPMLLNEVLGGRLKSDLLKDKILNFKDIEWK